MIKKRGSKFVVTNKSGTKVLGTHPSKEAAAKQLAAIEISKAKHMQHENKRFKDFRNTLTESEYKETLTGYPNRGINTEDGPVNFGPERMAQINAMLNAISRSTFQSPNEAFIRIKTRLNLLMLDFPWTPYLWSNISLTPPQAPSANATDPRGTVTVPVTLFGRVDGVDSMTGNVVMNGKANPTAGLKEFALTVSIEIAEDGLYRVTAKLGPKSEPVVAEEGVEHDGDSIEEENDNGLRTMFHHPKGKAVVNKSGKVIKIYRTERSARKHAITGKPVNEETELDEMAQTPARQRDMEHAIQRHDVKAQRGYEAKMNKTGKAAERGRKLEDKHDTAVRRLIARDTKEYESEKLYGRGGKIVKGKRKPVKEEVEPIEEMHKAGDSVKVPHKGKMVKGKIVRHDSGGSGKAQQHGGGYVVDVGEYGSITVPHHKIVKEELVGGQKKLDVNKNKRLDAQDFALLRNKKKAVKEYTEMMPGIPLMEPDPTMSQADQTGKGKRFHKKALKSSMEEAAKKPVKKQDPHAGARSVITKQKAIKRTLDQHGMRW